MYSVDWILLALIVSGEIFFVQINIQYLNGPIYFFSYFTKNVLNGQHNHVTVMQTKLNYTQIFMSLGDHWFTHLDLSDIYNVSVSLKLT